MWCDEGSGLLMRKNRWEGGSWKDTESQLMNLSFQKLRMCS